MKKSTLSLLVLCLMTNFYATSVLAQFPPPPPPIYIPPPPLPISIPAPQPPVDTTHLQLQQQAQQQADQAQLQAAQAQQQAAQTQQQSQLTQIQITQAQQRIEQQTALLLQQEQQANQQLAQQQLAINLISVNDAISLLRSGDAITVAADICGPGNPRCFSPIPTPIEAINEIIHDGVEKAFETIKSELASMGAAAASEQEEIKLRAEELERLKMQPLGPSQIMIYLHQQEQIIQQQNVKIETTSAMQDLNLLLEQQKQALRQQIQNQNNLMIENNRNIQRIDDSRRRFLALSIQQHAAAS